MKFTYMGGVVVRAVWALIVIGVVVALLTTLALSMAGEAYSGLNSTRSAFGQVTLVVGLVAIVLLFATPFFTSHEVAEHSLVLKQGVQFHAAIRYDEVEEVYQGIRRPIGLGVRWYPGALFVVTWPSNLVEIRLRRPRVFRILWIIPLPAVQTVVVNVDEPLRFLAALRERTGTY